MVNLSSQYSPYSGFRKNILLLVYYVTSHGGYIKMVIFLMIPKFGVLKLSSSKSCKFWAHNVSIDPWNEKFSKNNFHTTYEFFIIKGDWHFKLSLKMSNVNLATWILAIQMPITCVINIFFENSPPFYCNIRWNLFNVLKKVNLDKVWSFKPWSN